MSDDLARLKRLSTTVYVLAHAAASPEISEPARGVILAERDRVAFALREVEVHLSAALVHANYYRAARER